MTEAQSRSISENDYHHYRERQDEDLRREFVILHTRIEEGNENLRAELVQEFNNNLSTTEGTLSGKLGLLANELDNVKVDLRSLKNEVGEVKNEVGEVKNEVGEVNARLNQMEGRSYNKSRFLPSQAIESIGIFEPGIGFRKPTYFPRKIKDFWNLYHPDNEERLIYLIQFYDIQGYEYWGAENFNFDDSPTGDLQVGSSSESDSSQQILSLEDAIRCCPHRAIDELASMIGLDLEKIRNFYARQAEYQRRPQKRPTKRSPAEIDIIKGEDPKRVKKSDRRPSPLPYIPIHPPRSTPATKSISTDSPQTKVDWDIQSTEERRRNVLVKLDAGSPAEELTSQESRERRAGGMTGSKSGSTERRRRAVLDTLEDESPTEEITSQESRERRAGGKTGSKKGSTR